MLNRETTVLVVKDRPVEFAKAREVGDHVDPNHPSVRDGEAEHRGQTPTGSEDKSHPSVDERRLCEPADWEKATAPLAQFRAPRFPWRTRACPSFVDSDYDGWVKYRD
jgi:hypothetical protein